MTHTEIIDYNWDDGLEPIWPIVDNPITDRGTALLIYWRIEGPWLTDELTAHNPQLKRMKETLEMRLLDGFYRTRIIKYDPVSDYGLTNIQVYKLNSA